MGFDVFQFLDNEPIDNSVMKRDFLKVFYQQGAQLNQSDQNIEFIFGENNIYHQVCNGYLESDITVRKKDTTNFYIEDPIRLVKTFSHFVLKNLVCLQQLVQILNITNLVVKYLLL